MHSFTRAQRAVSWSLFASVVLNLFLAVALLAPPLLEHRPFGPMAMMGPHGDFMVDSLAMSLSPDDARIFRQAYAEEAEAMNSGREKIRVAMDELADLFESPNVDETALKDAINKAQLAREGLDTALSNVLTRIYVKLSPEGRHRLSKMKRDHAM